MEIDAVTSIFAGIPYDWLALGGILVLLALDSLRSGIGRSSAIAVALPIALVLFSLVSQTAFIGSLAILSSSVAQLATFGFLAFVVYFTIHRMGLDYIDSGRGEPIQALLAGAAASAVVAVVWLQLPMTADVWNVSDQIRMVFTEQYRLFWFIAAYGALAIARG